MNSVTFTVPGKARGKARPRVTRSGQHTYTPDPGGWAKSVGWEAVQQCGKTLWDGPIYLEFIVSKEMPKSWSKKKRRAMQLFYCTSKPDIVNIGATISDALEGIIYTNDKLIVEIRGLKLWDYKDETRITVRRC